MDKVSKFSYKNVFFLEKVTMNSTEQLLTVSYRKFSLRIKFHKSSKFNCLLNLKLTNISKKQLLVISLQLHNEIIK